MVKEQKKTISQKKRNIINTKYRWDNIEIKEYKIVMTS